MDRGYGAGHGETLLSWRYAENDHRTIRVGKPFASLCEGDWRRKHIGSRSFGGKKRSVQKEKGGNASSPLLRHSPKRPCGFRKPRRHLYDIDGQDVCSVGLFSSRSIYGTYACARTAVKTQIGIDHVLAVFFGNGFYRTFRSARAAADAIVRDFICHDTAPPFVRWYHSIINGAKKK